ncbi:hypothetical protein MKEN_00216000 [Mycena kentingensis (nom. inval.)]|nr:hypothetical protein MKEN_00216000 [Mycena kentingensis (nom. inval.)]
MYDKPELLSRALPNARVLLLTFTSLVALRIHEAPTHAQTTEMEDSFTEYRSSSSRRAVGKMADFCEMFLSCCVLFSTCGNPAAARLCCPCFKDKNPTGYDDYYVDEYGTPKINPVYLQPVSGDGMRLSWAAVDR